MFKNALYVFTILSLRITKRLLNVLNDRDLITLIFTASSGTPLNELFFN